MSLFYVVLIEEIVMPRQTPEAKIATRRMAAVELQGRRPEPPATLPDGAASIWRAVVSGFPPSYFRPADYPLVEAYARHCHQAARLDEHIDAMQSEWLKDEEGLKRYRCLLDARRHETSQTLALARSLRITHQSRVTKRGAASAIEEAQKEGMPRPWDAA